MSMDDHDDEQDSYIDGASHRQSGVDFDQYSELGPDDSASQIGRAPPADSPSGSQRREIARDNALQRLNAANASSSQLATRQTQHTTTVSRRTSPASSRLATPTTYIPSKRDRVRYSWQSIHGDESDRPRIHVIKIISNTATASAGLPGGEPLGFSISPGGRRIACYNSGRLFMLQTAALPVNISQEYALKRRPLAVEMVDEGGAVAVLADEHTINVYDLSHHRVKRLKTVKPDFAISAIALSPTGALLAAAYDSGVEIFSLAPNALSTDRRAARSAKMDKLQFSEDSSTLIGTTTRIDAAATVVVSVPLFPAAESGIPTHEELKEAWCTNMLEPTNIAESSHATFFRDGTGDNNERLFAWSAPEDTFGILGTQDLVYNNVDFPVSIDPPLSTCGGLGAAIRSVPALDERGETVGMVVNDRTVRLYVVPQAEDEASKYEAHSIDHELDEEFGCPFGEIRWVRSSSDLPAPKGDPSQVSGRLLAVSPGAVVDPNGPKDLIADVEGGRIIVIDFDPQYAGQPGQTFSFTLGKAPPQTLDEQEMDDEQQIALVRRRTVNASQRLTNRVPTIGRTASTVRRRVSERQPGIIPNGSPNSSAAPSPIEPNSTATFPRTRRPPSQVGGGDVLPDVDEAMEAMEEPFDGNHPRSVVSLSRAASAADIHQKLRVQQRLAENYTARQNGFMPVPEYSEEPNAPLPGRYRAMAGLEQPKKFEPSDQAAKSTQSSEISADAAPGAIPSAPNNESRSSHEESQADQASSSAAIPQRTQRTQRGQAPDIKAGLDSQTAPASARQSDPWTNAVRRQDSQLLSPVSASDAGTHQSGDEASLVSPVANAPPIRPFETRAEIEQREHQRIDAEREAARVQKESREAEQQREEVERQNREKERKEQGQLDREERERIRIENRTRFENRINANIALQTTQLPEATQPSSQASHPASETLEARSQTPASRGQASASPIRRSQTLSSRHSTHLPVPIQAEPPNFLMSSGPSSIMARTPSPNTSTTMAMAQSQGLGRSQSLHVLPMPHQQQPMYHYPPMIAPYPWPPPPPQTYPYPSAPHAQDWRRHSAAMLGQHPPQFFYMHPGFAPPMPVQGSFNGTRPMSSRSAPIMAAGGAAAAGSSVTSLPSTNTGGTGPKRKRRRWFFSGGTGKRTPKREYFEDGTWTDAERRCVVM